MSSVRCLLACLLPLSLIGCASPPPADRPVVRPAPIPNFSQVLVRRVPPQAAGTATPTATPTAAAKPATTAPASPSAARPAETELPLQTLPSWQVTHVAALSDAEALGPIVERPVPHGSDAYRPSVFVATKPPTTPRTVNCKAERSRQGLDEKISIGCSNSGKQTQTVFLQIDAVGLSGLPSPQEAKAGYPLAPGKSRTLVTLTTVSRPSRVDIAFTHEAAKP